MRLGTLARKTNITPSALTTHLLEQGIDLSRGTNTKLSEAEVASVLLHFDKVLPEPEPEPIIEEIEEVIEVEEKEQIIEVEEIVVKENAEPTIEEIEEPIDASDIETEKNIEPMVEEPEVDPIILVDNNQENDEFVENKEEPIFEVAEIPTAEVEAEPKQQQSYLSDSFSEMALPHELEMEAAEEEEVIEESKEELTSEIVEEEIVENIPEPVVVETTEAVEEEEKSTNSSAESDALSQAMLDADIESEVEMAALDDSIKVIKPKKVHLAGLTVKGKIELPKPFVKKEEQEVDKTENEQAKNKPAYDPNKVQTTQGPESDKRRKPKNYKGKKYDKGYNPVEAARKKKEWEEKKKSSIAEKKKKSTKEKYYKTKSKPVELRKPAKKKIKKISIKKKPVKFEGNALQRFWQWMNT